MTQLGTVCGLPNMGILSQYRGSSGSAFVDNPVNKKEQVSLLEVKTSDTPESMTFYVASKTKHAPMWRRFRDLGLRINSTWIDEAGNGQTHDFTGLALRCIQEASSADGVILYAEPEDKLKGALLECGAALAGGRPVVMVGRSDPLSRVFDHHPLWFSAPTVDEAARIVAQIVDRRNNSEDTEP